MHLRPAVSQQYWNQREGLEDWRLGVMAMAGREAGCWSEGGGHTGKGKGWGKCARRGRDERGIWARGWTKVLCPLKKTLLMIYHDFRGKDQIIHRTPFLKDLSPAHLCSFISQVAGSLSSWVLLPQPAVIAFVLNFLSTFSFSSGVPLSGKAASTPVTSFSVSPVPLYSLSADPGR